MNDQLSESNGNNVTIARATLEKSLEYLVCPNDKEKLKLDVGSQVLVKEGSFSCTSCDEVFIIENGIPNFVRLADEYNWNIDLEDFEIIEIIKESLDDPRLVQAQISALGNFFYERSNGDRRYAIMKLNETIENVIENDKISENQIRDLIVTTNEARYDLEIYRNALIVPYKILSSAIKNYKKKDGIIFEGGCASGDCLLYTTTAFDADFYIGADISLNMIREAQKKAGKNTLFVRADVQLLPLRTGSVGVAIEQNIWDRLPDPPAAIEQIDRVLSLDGSVILSQCIPPQYESNDGKIVYVPQDKRLSLRQIIGKLGFKIKTQQTILWTPYTVQDGQEALPTDSYFASK